MQKTNSLQKVDKFYVALIITLVLLSGLVIFSFRSVFSAYLTAYEFSQKDLQSDLAIDDESLTEAYDWVFNKQTVPLELRN